MRLFGQRKSGGFDRLRVRHKEWSAVSSLDDEPYGPSPRLLDLTRAAFDEARHIDLTIFDDRKSTERAWYKTWPGEHYKWLAAITRVLRPSVAVEIGTFTGMGALSILQELPSDGRLVTFDIAPWRVFPETHLEERDFTSGQLSQEIADISTKAGFAAHRDLIASADFIFLDGPKDAASEPKMIEALGSIDLKPDVVVMFDDIRLLNMLDIWRNIHRPKFDVTSFGHWSGTGLVDWNG